MLHHVCTFLLNFKKVFHLLHQAYTHSVSFSSVDPTTMGPPLYQRERIYYNFVKVVFCEVRICGFCEGYIWFWVFGCISNWTSNSPFRTRKACNYWDNSTKGIIILCLSNLTMGCRLHHCLQITHQLPVDSHILATVYEYSLSPSII